MPTTSCSFCVLPTLQFIGIYQWNSSLKANSASIVRNTRLMSYMEITVTCPANRTYKVCGKGGIFHVKPCASYNAITTVILTIWKPTHVRKAPVQIHSIYFANKEIHCIFYEMLHNVLLSTKRRLLHCFTFFSSNNTFFINQALKFKHPPDNIKIRVKTTPP